MPFEIVVMSVLGTLIPAVVAIVLGLPLVKLIARRFDRGTVPASALERIDERLARLETSIDTMAVEVERIAEAQRFTAKLLAERAGVGDGGREEG
ncbi:MAG TPA: hypothetical protein VFY16_10090 [Gemmatimonadaceae bacterium]|nr:hypothetical protein [Gemmatimonadaceae bacterium]